MALIESRDAEVPVEAACLALNVSRASVYRSRGAAGPPGRAGSRPPLEATPGPSG
jgi:hypothetical protein